MKKIELFAGSGGGLLAGKLLGHKVVAAVEIDAYNRKLLKARCETGDLPSAMQIEPDVVSFHPEQQVDLVCGGFPCTDISAAGRGAGLEGKASRLIWDMLRICDEAKASFIFAENSDRLRTKGLAQILPRLWGMGYRRIGWAVLGAAHVGAPHLRKRMWLLACKTSGGNKTMPSLPASLPFNGTLTAAGLNNLGQLQAVPGLLPTITVGDSRHSGNRPDQTLWSLSDMLGITQKFKRRGITMPTMVASDFKGHSGVGTRRLMGLRSRPLRDVLPLVEGGTCINPSWAEWFMGWPIGWTDLSWQPNVAQWQRFTEAHHWWTDEVEQLVLPRTLAKRPAHYVDRIFALGNGQVPACAAQAFLALQRLLV